MAKITFTVEQESDGGYVAWWDDPQGGGISTQGNNLAELQSMILDAVACHFEGKERPASIRLHFKEDVALAVA
jgi:predicted RNase H-like HicB family nuclease